MSIKSTLVCDGCGRELTGKKRGVDERLDLLEIAVENGWACAFDHFCPECVAYANAGGSTTDRADDGKAVAG